MLIISLLLKSFLLNNLRKKGLCFYCDDKYTKFLKCKNQKLTRLEITEEEDDELESKSDQEDLDDSGPMAITFCQEQWGLIQ